MKPKRAFTIFILPLIIAIIACAGAVGGVGLTQLAPTLARPADEAPVELPTTDSGQAAPLPTAPIVPVSLSDSIFAQEATLIDLYRRVSPGVVAISVFGSFGSGQGSGFVIDDQGHIVTNAHVVADAETLEVTFFDGRKAFAEVLGTDSTADLAVIKVDRLPDNLTPVPLGDSDALQVGQVVIAIGTPFGYEGTMTVGIVSGIGRTLIGDIAPEGGSFSSPDVIQTDAAINPGNSGGPLFNLAGEVVGVNRAIVSNSGSNSGVGFSVASNTVKRIAPNLINFGYHEYAYMGVSSVDAGQLSLTQIEQIELPGFLGAYIVRVPAGGPAEQAGLRGDRDPQAPQLAGGGDFITHIDGVQMRTFADVLSYLVNHTAPGQQVVLTVIRDGQTIEVPLTLGTRP